MGLLLAEIVNPVFDFEGGMRGESSFNARRFRPAKTTSLDVFKEMLGPAPRVRKLEPA